MAEPKKVNPAGDNGKKLSVVKQNDAATVEKAKFDEMQRQLKEAEKKAESLQKELDSRKATSIADVLVKANHAKTLEQKLESLEKAKIKLAALQNGDEEVRNVLTLSSGDNLEFSTYNSEIFKQVKELIEAFLDVKLSETKKELLALG